MRVSVADFDAGHDICFRAAHQVQLDPDVSYLLFRRMAEGKLSFEQQTMLKTLGIKF